MKERVFISLVIYIGDERKSACKFNDFFLGGGGGGIDNYNYREEIFKSQF